jgi:hypothetical protein
MSEAGVGVGRQGRGLSGDGVEEWELQTLFSVLVADAARTNLPHERVTQG